MAVTYRDLMSQIIRTANLQVLWGLNPRRRRLDEGGQKPHEIRPGTIIDFTALTEQFELWPKTNGFGYPTTVKKTGDNAWTPMFVSSVS
jgi:hypothetical protein